MLRFWGASEQPSQPPIPPPVQSVSPHIPASSRPQRVPASSPTSSRVPTSCASDVGTLKAEIGRLSQQLQFLQEQQASKDVSRDLLLEQLQDGLMRVRRERDQEVRESDLFFSETLQKLQAAQHLGQGNALMLEDQPGSNEIKKVPVPQQRDCQGLDTRAVSLLNKQNSLLLLEAIASRSKLRVAKASLAPSPRQYLGASAAVCRGLLSHGSRRRSTYSPPNIYVRNEQQKLPVARILGLEEGEGEGEGEEKSRGQVSTLPLPPPSPPSVALGASSPRSACINRIEDERIKIGSLLGRVHDNRAKILIQAREAGSRIDKLVEENKDLRGQLLELQARSSLHSSVEEVEVQTDQVPSESEIDLSCRLEEKKSELVALQSKLKEYQMMLVEAQGEMEEMQVNARSLRQGLEEAEAKLAVSQSRPLKARRSSTAQRLIHDPSSTSREGTPQSSTDRTPTKRARVHDEQEATKARVRSCHDDDDDDDDSHATSSFDQMDEIQLVLSSILEEKERLRTAHEAQILSIEQRHTRALAELRAQAEESETKLSMSEEKRTSTESFLDQLKIEYQKLLTDHNSLQQQLLDNKEKERSDGGGSSFCSAGEQSQGGLESSGGGSTAYQSVREGEGLGGCESGSGGGGGGGGGCESGGGGGCVEFYPEEVKDPSNQLTLNPLFFPGEEEEEGGVTEGDPSDLPLPLSEAPTFLFPLDSSRGDNGGLGSLSQRSLDYEAVSSLNNPLFDIDSRMATEVLTPAPDPGPEPLEQKVEERFFDPAFTFSRNSSCFDEEVQPSFNLTASAKKQKQEEEARMMTMQATMGTVSSSPDPTSMTDEEIVAYSKSLTSRILSEVHSLAGQLEAVRTTSSPFAPATTSPPPTHRYPDLSSASGSGLSEALGRLKEHLSGLQHHNRAGREEGASDWGSVDASQVVASPWKSPAWPVSMTPVTDRRVVAATNEATRTMRPLMFDSPS